MRPDPVSRYSRALGGTPSLRKSVAAVSDALKDSHLPKPIPAHLGTDDGRDLPASDGTQANEIRPELSDRKLTIDELELRIQHAGPPIPAFWTKGQLLNVRNNGAEFVVTILGEEFDPRYPHRALHFDNSFTCQAFISKWYAREHHDPRAG